MTSSPLDREAGQPPRPGLSGRTANAPDGGTGALSRRTHPPGEGPPSPPPPSACDLAAAGGPSPAAGEAGPAAGDRSPAAPGRGRAPRAPVTAVPDGQSASGPAAVTGRTPAGGARPSSATPAGSTGRAYTIALPAGLQLLSLNDRGHWAARYKRSQAFKEAAWAMALKGKVPRLACVFVAAVYQPPPDWRDRDSDNPMLSVKAAIDGIVAAKVLPGDECPRYVTGVYCTIGEPYPGGRLVLNLLPGDPVRELAGLAGLKAGAV